MKRAIAILLAGLLSLSGAPALAFDGVHASYASGTVDSIAPETSGALSTTAVAALEFHADKSQFSIPYAEVTSFQYKEESKLHLGVLATIVVALVAPWKKVDRITIVWSGEQGAPEVATLVLSRHDGEGLISILQARAAQACGRRPSSQCGRVW
ncbi:MAG TPA: hypothetical protein VMD55_00010 [Terracidiphilus sp.]|nr:hypothetical protein [Terracidiphilus sp.]